ncbi:unnamed protein product [marine sediment metagenome]|uniref:Uncharacterized protein n=1 Tax=marine sediment metagenome TaxID=412755 RepID=X0UK53_9ZZZZ
MKVFLLILLFGLLMTVVLLSCPQQVDNNTTHIPLPPPPESLTDPLWEAPVVKTDDSICLIPAPMARYRNMQLHFQDSKTSICPFCNQQGLDENSCIQCPKCQEPWPPSESYFRDLMTKDGERFNIMCTTQ